MFTLRNEGIVANPAQLSLPALRALCVSGFSPASLSRFNFKLSTLNCFSPKSSRIRTYAKRARNPFTMNTSKTKDLKSFRMNTYEKKGRGVGVLFSKASQTSSRISDFRAISASSTPNSFYSLFTTHYSLPTTHFCPV
jgi:hypothetical protein